MHVIDYNHVALCKSLVRNLVVKNPVAPVTAVGAQYAQYAHMHSRALLQASTGNYLEHMASGLNLYQVTGRRGDQ